MKQIWVQRVKVFQNAPTLNDREENEEYVGSVSQ